MLKSTMGVLSLGALLIAAQASFAASSEMRVEVCNYTGHTVVTQVAKDTMNVTNTAALWKTIGAGCTTLASVTPGPSSVLNLQLNTEANGAASPVAHFQSFDGIVKTPTWNVAPKNGTLAYYPATSTQTARFQITYNA